MSVKISGRFLSIFLVILAARLCSLFRARPKENAFPKIIGARYQSGFVSLEEIYTDSLLLFHPTWFYGSFQSKG